jgi:WD40 repeat protein
VGKLLASGSGDGRQTDSSVRIWDVRTGKELFRQKMNSQVGSVAFTHDARLVAAGDQGEIRLWDVATAELKQETGGKNPVAGGWIAFSSDGPTVASPSSTTGAIRLWDLSSGKDLRELSGHKEGVWSASFDAKGQMLASTGRDGNFQIWDVTTGKGRVLFTVKPNGIQHVSLSPDGKLLGGTAGKLVYLWDVSTGKESRRFENHEWAMGLAFSPDGKTLAWGGGGTIYLAAVHTGRPTLQQAGHKGRVSKARFSPDGRRIVTVGGDLTVRVWESVTGRELYQLAGGVDAAFLPDGKTLVSVAPDSKSFQRWESESGKELPLTSEENRNALPRGSQTFSEDGRYFIGPRRGEMQTRLWETSTGKELGQFTDGGILGHHVASPEGKYVAVLAEPFAGASVALWEVAAGREVRRLDLDNISLSSLAFSPDATILATGGHEIQLWNVSTGKPIRKMKVPLGYVSALALSPDGKSLVAGGGFEATAYLYELVTGELRTRFEGNVGRLDAVAFSPDGKLLVTAGWDGTPLVWYVTGTRSPPGPKTKPADKELAACWAALGGEDATEAWRAERMLMSVPDQAVPLLRERLMRQAADEKKIERLIAELDHDEFEVRERASQQLAALGKTAEPALRKAQARSPSAEVNRRVKELLVKLETAALSTEELRGLRAVEVLEHVGTPNAREILGDLAKGPGNDRLTQESKAAIQRLEKRLAVLP